MDYGPQLLNDILNEYIQAINSGFGLLRGDVAFVFNVLIIISMVWSAFTWAFSEDQVIVELCRKCIYIGFFVWLVQNWPDLTKTFGDTFISLGLKAGGLDHSSTYVREPGNIAYLGWTAAQPVIDQIYRLSGPVAFFRNFAEIALLCIAFVAILASFCIMTIQLVMALLIFKLGSLAAFVLVPFGVITKTSFIAERPLGWVVGSCIRLLVLTLVLGVGNNIFQKITLPQGEPVSGYQAFIVALCALVLMVLGFVASRLATDLIVGGPTLGVGSAAGTVRNVSNLAGGAIKSTPAVLAVGAAAKVTTGAINSIAGGLRRQMGGRPAPLLGRNGLLASSLGRSATQGARRVANLNGNSNNNHTQDRNILMDKRGMDAL